VLVVVVHVHIISVFCCVCCVVASSCCVSGLSVCALVGWFVVVFCISLVCAHGLHRFHVGCFTRESGKTGGSELPGTRESETVAARNARGGQDGGVVDSGPLAQSIAWFSLNRFYFLVSIVSISR